MMTQNKESENTMSVGEMKETEDVRQYVEEERKVNMDNELNFEEMHKINLDNSEEFEEKVDELRNEK